MIRRIVYTIIVYFTGIFAFKLLGDFDNIRQVNYYWLFSSMVFAAIFNFLAILVQEAKVPYPDKDHKFYFKVIRSFSAYWSIMALLRLIVAIDIKLYNILIVQASYYAIGIIVIVMIYIYLACNLTLNDNTDEGQVD